MFRKNYSKPGPGVEKRDPNQSRISIFFEILRGKFWDLLKLNLLYVLFSIPAFIITCIVTGFLSAALLNAINMDENMVWSAYIAFNLFFGVSFGALLGFGPSTAALTYTLRNIGREEHVWLFSDFRDKIKENFKQSFGLWILDLVVFALVVFAYNFYANAGEPISYLRYLLLSFALIYIMLHLFVYQLMITFELPLKALMKNAVLFALAKAPKCFILLLFVALIHIGLPIIAIANIASPFVTLIFFALEIFLLPALTSFVTNFAIYPTIEEYIKIAEENKE